MRALGLGSMFLGCVLALLSWDAARRFAFERPGAEMPAFRTATLRAKSPAEPAPAAGIDPAPSIPGVRGTEAPSSGSRNDAMGPGGATRQAEPVAGTQRGGLPRLAVTQLVPGSKAHAESIASTLASEEYRTLAEPVARLYFAFFDRAADYEGFNYYLEERDAGLTLEAMAEQFAGSDEFRLRYGTLDNAAFFDRVYRNVFDGVADASLRSAWIAQLDAGMSRGQLMVAFSESNAFRAATSNEVFVTMAFAEALGREPDPAGLARWVRFLDAGNPREAVIAGLLGSARAKR